MSAAPAILLVCLGNICRSPAAEAVLRARAPGLVLDSAGTSDWHVGEPPYGPMQAAARARGIEMGDLRARQARAADFDRFGLILAMDRKNLAALEALRPAGNGTALQLFTAHAGTDAPEDVPDPYYTRDFDGCLDLIERAAGGWLAALRAAGHDLRIS